MAFLTGKTLKVLVNQYNLTPYFRGLTPSLSKSVYDTTTFGSSAKTFVPGIVSGAIAVEGIMEASATVDNPEAVFAAINNSATVPLVSIAMNGFALGERVYLLQAHEQDYKIQSVIDDLIKNSASFVSNDGFDFGTSLHDLTAETVTGNGTGADYTTGSTNGGVGYLHLVTNGGTTGTIVIKIQHSTDNVTFTDLVTFTTVNAGVANITSERIVVAAGTTVNRYLRAIRTVTGTPGTGYTYAVGFARR